MAILPADLMLPPAGTGELDPAWWAPGLLPTLLAVWIAAGEGQAPGGASGAQADAITTAYAYGTAYDAKVLQMAGTPGRENLAGTEFNSEFAKDQRDRFAERALYWWGQFSTAVADATPVVAVPAVDNAPRASYSQPIARSF